MPTTEEGEGSRKGDAAAAPAAVDLQPEESSVADIRTPTPNDVLCGRGGIIDGHPGNERFRDLVRARKPLYHTSGKSRNSKAEIAREIVRMWRDARDPAPGRFLAKNEETGMWYEIGDQKARAKTSQALREADKSGDTTFSSEEKRAGPGESCGGETSPSLRRNPRRKVNCTTRDPTATVESNEEDNFSSKKNGPRMPSVSAARGIVAVPAPFAASDEETEKKNKGSASDDDADDEGEGDCWHNRTEDGDESVDSGSQGKFDDSSINENKEAAMFSEDEGDDFPEKCIFAVRRGLNVQNCIFLYWDDCAAQVENCENSEYEAFTLFQDAAEYMTSWREEEAREEREKRRLKRRRKRSRKVYEDEDEDSGLSASAEERSEGKWNDMYERLKKFKSEKGHMLVRASDGDAALFYWANAQKRHSHRWEDGKPSAMTQEKYDQLKAIDFSFSFTKARQETGDCATQANTVEVGPLAAAVPTANGMAAAKPFVSPLVIPPAANQMGVSHASIDMEDEEARSYAPREVAKTLATKIGTQKEDKKKAAKRSKGKNRYISESKANDSEEEALALEFASESEKKVSGTASMDQEKPEPGKKWEQRWESMFQALQEYQEANGHCYIRTSKDMDKKVESLYKWCAHQRREYMKFENGERTVLTKERVDRLDSMGFIFTNLREAKKRIFGESSGTTRVPSQGRQDKLKEKWEAMFLELEKFKEQYGHCFVPSAEAEQYDLLPNTYPFDPKLSRWAYTQRRYGMDKKKDKKSPLTDERMERLAQLGFVFESLPAAKREFKMGDAPNSDQKWEDYFELLHKFKDSHGHCDVSRKEPEHLPLYKWAMAQRQNYRRLQDGKSSPLTADRMMKLNEIGFSMKIKPGTKKSGKETIKKGRKPNMYNGRIWDEWYEELCTYQKENGTTRVPNSPYTQLRGWCLKQKYEFKKVTDGKPSILSAEQIARMTQLGFDFKIQENSKWEDRFKELEQFKETHGHILVPRHVGTLGKWLAVQRQKKKASGCWEEDQSDSRAGTTADRLGHGMAGPKDARAALRKETMG
uniref:Helicase-associated domain-containing protein n=1 Tax=Odontella aurita TaxID=265563 RepID=A0A6U6FZT4_9STRA|mmetsp:Transcript_38893/g.116960  ORF Transcript_38893/g.116960 Transcript_38893/m.116960 type:complete len:1043 (+) Transcript_38893:136-3264(+)